MWMEELIKLEMDPCLLCRGSGRPLVKDKNKDGYSETVTDKINKIWGERCIKGICRLLRMPTSSAVVEVLLKTNYCDNCTQILRDAEFLLNQIDSIDSNLTRIRETLWTKVRDNYEEAAETYGNFVSGPTFEDLEEVKNFVELSYDDVLKMFYQSLNAVRGIWSSLDFMRVESPNSFDDFISAVKKGGCNDEAEDYYGSDADDNLDNFMPYEESPIRAKIVKTKTKAVPEAENPDVVSRKRTLRQSERKSYKYGESDSNSEGNNNPKKASLDVNKPIERTKRQKMGHKTIENGISRGISEVDPLENVEVKLEENVSQDHEDEEHQYSSASDSSCSNYSNPSKRKKRRPIAERLGYPSSCNLCKKRLQSQTSYERHMLSHTNAAIKCSRCKREFKTKDEFQIHRNELKKNGKTKLCQRRRKKTPKEGAITCEHVDCANYTKIFLTDTHLLGHHRTVHEGNPFPFDCEPCNKKFRNAFQYLEHMLRHSDDRPKCSQCGKAFNTKKSLTHHLLVCVPSSLKCKFCNAICKDDQSRKEHENLHATNEFPFQCLICGLKLTNSTDLTRHTTSKHVTSESNNDEWICELCGNTCFSKASLAKHKKTHEKRPLFSCITCGKPFVTKDSMQKHVSREHVDDGQPKMNAKEKFICDICGKVYSGKKGFTRHVKAHAETKPYNCTICEKSFKSREGLKCHEETHSAFKKYLCKVCGKRFHAKCNYQQHMLVHRGWKRGKGRIYERLPVEENFSSDSEPASGKKDDTHQNFSKKSATVTATTADTTYAHIVHNPQPLHRNPHADTANSNSPYVASDYQGERAGSHSMEHMPCPGPFSLPTTYFGPPFPVLF